MYICASTRGFKPTQPNDNGHDDDNDHGHVSHDRIYGAKNGTKHEALRDNCFVSRIKLTMMIAVVY